MTNLPPPPPPPEPSRDYGSGGGSSDDAGAQPEPWESSQMPSGKVWTSPRTGEQVPLAHPGMRLLARIIDAAILAVIFLVIFFVSAIASGISFEEDSADLEQGSEFMLVIFWVFVLVSILYEILFIGLRGKTLGKMMAKIVVVRVDDSELPGIGKAIARWALPGLLGMASFVMPSSSSTMYWIGNLLGLLSLVVYLSLTWDSLRQGWHDKYAETVVLKVQ